MSEEYLNLLPFTFICLAGVSLIFLSIYKIKYGREKSILKKYIKKRDTNRDSFLDDWLDSKNFIIKFEEKNNKKFGLIDEKISPRKITKVTMFSMLMGLIFSIIIRNIIALPIVITISFYLPQLYLDMVVKNKKIKIEQQLGICIKFFTSEFTTCKSVVVSFQNISNKLPNPIRGEIERLIREMNSGYLAVECLNGFAKRMDNRFAYIFSNLLISYFNKGTDIGEHLVRISNEITDAQGLHKENKTELAMVRATNLILNGVVFISIILMFLLFPKYSQSFRNTASGQTLVTLVIFNSFISIILGLKLENH